MKLYAKQMNDWNCYAYYAEDVDEKYWHYFKDGCWWQLGSSFIKTYDNVADFQFCADNFTKNGEIFIKQCLKIIDAPWKKALDLFMEKIKEANVPWYIHGSAAMALWDIDVKPRNLDIIIPNASDFDKVRAVFYKFAILPIQRCDNWIMSGGGDIFLEAPISIYFNNKELEPFDMNTLHKINYNGTEIYISTLNMLKQDNTFYGRPDRVKLIEEKIKQNLYSATF